MRSKTQSSINLKLVFICCSVLVLLVLFLTRTNVSSSSNNTVSRNSLSNSTGREEGDEDHHKPRCPSPHLNPSCTKMPASLADALVHYVTTSITPQQTFDEVSVSKRVLDKKSPCNFLVFGLGHDSLMWASLNHGGRTLFLEEDKSWIETVTQKFPNLESYHVIYDTKVKDSDKLMELGKTEDCKTVSDPRDSKCALALKGFPADVYETEWDLIMVDAPTGYHEAAPGRMSAIYTAGLMARNRESGETDVFVHDVDRPVEDEFSATFLCGGYLREEQGRLRHFTIPSHRARAGRPFCPAEGAPQPPETVSRRPHFPGAGMAAGGSRGVF
ncbi:PREDICTED: glucuronoxylan 4-O-methyltransferase 3-like [Tarenaya hassleriana]|uniref:glucuronoxylan 4-O-methyltransferase 3-like n=1 Tax=Tarenaya hassleriana TaxID=28532 RepID=UPI00053C32FE|nr:PREDICTED: glucuronoxylan 4-O-methyltransferase 3-like [Tarenaya hassleriana]